MDHITERNETPVIVGMEHAKKEEAKDNARNAKDTVVNGISSALKNDPQQEGAETAPGTPNMDMAEPAVPTEPKYMLSISENVVEKISSLAARKVGGIVDMKGNVFSMIQETFGANVKSKGVNADVADNGEAQVELSIILEYGKSAVEVFEGLKRVISEDVSHMTGLNISQLTVNVVDVMNDQEIAEKRRKESDSAAGSDTASGITM